jgi:hypothetical protein
MIIFFHDVTVLVWFMITKKITDLFTVSLIEIILMLFSHLRPDLLRVQFLSVCRIKLLY